MNVKWSKPGECTDLHRLMEAVLKLRLRVASLEKVQNLKRLGRHAALLNFSASSRLTQVDAEREKQALQEKLVRCRILLSEFPEGVTAKNLNDLADELERKILALHRVMKPLSVITCPHCQCQATETMPTNACKFLYDCAGCGKRLKPLPGDCCVFCSFGTVPCPPMQEDGKGASCG
jgi:hypothetical protein